MKLSENITTCDCCNGSGCRPDEVGGERDCTICNGTGKSENYRKKYNDLLQKAREMYKFCTLNERKLLNKLFPMGYAELLEIEKEK